MIKSQINNDATNILKRCKEFYCEKYYLSQCLNLERFCLSRASIFSNSTTRNNIRCNN